MADLNEVRLIDTAKYRKVLEIRLRQGLISKEDYAKEIQEIQESEAK